MPSGPKKRHAARRRSMGGRPGTRTSLEKAGFSDSHDASDEGTSPKTSDYVNSRLSLSTGTNERQADLTFQTEEWVRVSDFDVGTPTSITAKSDFDTQDSFGDVRGHDKLVDWETVSRGNAGNSSSAEEVGEVDNLAAEDSLGSGREPCQKSPHVDVLLSDLDSSVSEKEHVDRSVSSRSVGGNSSRSSTATCSSGSRFDGYLKKTDEERSSSIVVVPSHREHEDDSQESSYAEVASVDARGDDCHGSVANVSSLEGKEVDNQGSSAIEPASSEEQEEDNYELFSGAEDHASSAIEPASSEEQEEEKYRLFTDVSNLKDLLEEESSWDPISLPSRFDSFSSFISSHINESVTTESEGHRSSKVGESGISVPKVMEEDHQNPRHLKTEDDQKQELKDMKLETPEVNKSRQEATASATSEPYAHNLPEIHPPERILEGGSAAEEFTHGIEPTTPEKTSEKSFSETLYTYVRSASDEGSCEGARASPLKVDQSAPTESISEAQWFGEHIAKEVHDSGIPEPNQEELNQLIEIAYFKEIAGLGKEEEKLLVLEEQELGKDILVEVLSATDHSQPLGGAELKDVQSVVLGKAPLFKDSPSPVDSDLYISAELKDRVPELFTKESGEGLPEESQGGVGDEHQTAETSHIDSSTSADLSLQTKLPLAAESTKDVEATSEAVNVDGPGKIVRSSEKLEQVTDQRTEDQPRILGPIQASSDTCGCCEPVQWLVSNFSRWINRPAIRN